MPGYLTSASNLEKMQRERTVNQKIEVQIRNALATLDSGIERVIVGEEKGALIVECGSFRYLLVILIQAQQRMKAKLNEDDPGLDEVADLLVKMKSGWGLVKNPKFEALWNRLEAAAKVAWAK